ncbi:DUF1048 domain-containing protein [Herbiconiux sp. L3-i23]|uniref:DUF1048 domain-containing protein n=1 Tax=Herbiconiux sp. L3-i23 TaxID=2905871 RepID=UPI00206259AD|nr:DUF1048 domain-containing protein [Herbiconiux sp. L3-i23]BDI21352.1 hypothetical protein L3i23_01280 [Herbiconiux sp. L3-i23]
MNTSLTWIEKLVGSIDDKKQYRDYRARVRRLPGDYRSTAEAIERYLTHVGPTSDSDALLAVLTDLVERLEAGVARGASVADVIGDDPVAFAEELLRVHPGAGWMDGWIGSERTRLTDAVRAASASAGAGGAR